MSNIYFSYCQKDYPIVKAIYNSLTQKGYSIFMDKYQEASEVYAEDITKKINGASVVLLFYSDNLKRTTWAKREIEYALAKRKKVIPLLLTTITNDDEWFNFHLGNLQSIPYTEDGYDEAFVRKVVNELERLIQRDEQSKLSPNHVPIDDDLSREEAENKERKRYNIKSKLSPDYSTTSSNEFGIGYSCLAIAFIIIVVIVGLFFYYDTKSESECRELSHSNIGYPYDESGNTNRSANPDWLDEDDEELPNSTDSQDVPNTNWPYYVLTCITGCVFTLLFQRVKRKKKDNVKMSSNIASIISIDGVIEKEISPREVYMIHLEEGEYLIDFLDISNNKRHMTFNHKVEKRKCELVYANFKDESSQEDKTIKCFIAGSKTLQSERDALRAVTCIMYNKWANKNFRILSYTFEDFERAAVVDGHQKQYNDFIVEEADWALFVIDGKVGGITIEEYRKAMDAYKKNGKPKVLAFAKEGSENNEEVAAIKREINREHQYWTDYTDINSLKLLFESTLNWDLIDIFQK